MRFLLPIIALACTHEVHFPTEELAPELPSAVPSEAVYTSAAIEFGKEVVCDNPSARDELGPFIRKSYGDPANQTDALAKASVLAGDFDSDGFLDLVLPSEPSAKLFHGNGSQMEARAALDGIDLPFGVGGTVADLDIDGDLDVLVVRDGLPDRMLRNEGDGTFVDITHELPTLSPGATTTSAWADLDGDGDLDLFLGTNGDGAQLLENTGYGGFIDRSALLPPELQTATVRAGGFHDVNGDGAPDLMLATDIGSSVENLVLFNEAGRLVRRDDSVGLASGRSGAGLAAGDINHDGVPDFVIPQWGNLALMISHEGVWVDRADSLGMVPDRARGQEVGWGAELADIDNDSRTDAIVAFGYRPGWDNPDQQPDALFLQQADGTFLDVAPEWGVDDAGWGRGFVVADFDGNGWLDLIKRDAMGPSALYLARCGESSWVGVEARQPGTNNPFAVGTQLTAFVGDLELTRTIRAGGTGFGSGGPPLTHFGLGSAERIDRIEVRWPDGEISVLTDLPTNRQVRITR